MGRRWSRCRVDWQTTPVMIYKTLITFRSSLRGCEVTHNCTIVLMIDEYYFIAIATDEKSCCSGFLFVSHAEVVTFIVDIIAAGRQSPLLQLAFVLIKLRGPKWSAFSRHGDQTKPGFVLAQRFPSVRNDPLCSSVFSVFVGGHYEKVGELDLEEGFICENVLGFIFIIFLRDDCWRRASGLGAALQTEPNDVYVWDSSGSSILSFPLCIWNFCLPATTIHARSHVTFPAFYFSIVSYMRLLFQLQGQYCFSLTTKQQIIRIYMELSFRSVPP